MNRTCSFSNNFSIRKKIICTYSNLKQNPGKAVGIMGSSLLGLRLLAFIACIFDLVFLEKALQINLIEYNSKSGDKFYLDASLPLKSPFSFKIHNLNIQFLDEDSLFCELYSKDMFIKANNRMVIKNDFKVSNLNGSKIFQTLTSEFPSPLKVKMTVDLTLYFWLFTKKWNFKYEKDIKMNKKKNEMTGWFFDISLPSDDKENNNVKFDANINTFALAIPKFLKINLSEFNLHLTEPRCYCSIQPIIINNGKVYNNNVYFTVFIDKDYFENALKQVKSNYKEKRLKISIRELTGLDYKYDSLFKNFLDDFKAIIDISDKNKLGLNHPNITLIAVIEKNKDNFFVFDFQMEIPFLMNRIHDLKVTNCYGILRGDVYIDDKHIGTTRFDLIEKDGKVVKDTVRTSFEFWNYDHLLSFLLFKRSYLTINMNKLSFLNKKSDIFSLVLDAHGHHIFDVSYEIFAANLQKEKVDLFANKIIKVKHKVRKVMDNALEMQSSVVFNKIQKPNKEKLRISIPGAVDFKIQSAKVCLNFIICKSNIEVINDSKLSISDRLFGNFNITTRLVLKPAFYKQDTKIIYMKYLGVKKQCLDNNSVIQTLMVSRYNILIDLFTENGVIKCGKSKCSINLEKLIGKYQIKRTEKTINFVKNRTINFFANMEVHFGKIQDGKIEIIAHTEEMEFGQDYDNYRFHCDNCSNKSHFQENDKCPSCGSKRNIKYNLFYKILHLFEFDVSLSLPLSINGKKILNIETDCKGFSLLQSSNGIEGIILDHNKKKDQKEHIARAFVDMGFLFGHKNINDLMLIIMESVGSFDQITIDDSGNHLEKIIWKIISTIANANMYDLEDNVNRRVQMGTLILRLLTKNIITESGQKQKEFTLGYSYDYKQDENYISTSQEEEQKLDPLSIKLKGLALFLKEMEFIAVDEDNNTILSILTPKANVCIFSKNNFGFSQKRMNVKIKMTDSNIKIKNVKFKLRIDDAHIETPLYKLNDESFKLLKYFGKQVIDYKKKMTKINEKEKEEIKTKINDKNKDNSQKPKKPHIDITNQENHTQKNFHTFNGNVILNLDKYIIQKILDIFSFVDFSYKPKHLGFKVNIEKMKILQINTGEIVCIDLGINKIKCSTQLSLIDKPDCFEIRFDYSIQMENKKFVEPFSLMNNLNFQLSPLINFFMKDEKKTTKKDEFFKTTPRYNRYVLKSRLGFSFKFTTTQDYYLISSSKGFGNVCFKIPFQTIDEDLFLFVAYCIPYDEIFFDTKYFIGGKKKWDMNIRVFNNELNTVRHIYLTDTEYLLREFHFFIQALLKSCNVLLRIIMHNFLDMVFYFSDFFFSKSNKDPDDILAKILLEDIENIYESYTNCIFREHWL